MRKILIGVSLLALVACTNKDDAQAPAKAALLGCDTVVAELKILLPLRQAGKLPPEALKIIDGQRDITDPFCLGPAPGVNDTYVDIAIDSAAKSLTAIAVKFVGN